MWLKSWLKEQDTSDSQNQKGYLRDKHDSLFLSMPINFALLVPSIGMPFLFPCLPSGPAPTYPHSLRPNSYVTSSSRHPSPCSTGKIWICVPTALYTFLMQNLAVFTVFVYVLFFHTWKSPVSFIPSPTSSLWKEGSQIHEALRS